ncbi:protein phosphatase 1 regulatory subunit [Holotrichia oblita]|uniref:Protein phosphatase 1 regulatory subunit n=1 Tax=Holotrichia oblita TaxID=644536 RepID=A0ACB9TSZ6_HOLOL|nr:protein phosphatase 1 regulatory subunit [Holotrichia oblita]
MTTGSDKCSISSIIPMSCRDKAEAFARRLHSRLSSLGSQDGLSADENSWLAARRENLSVAVTQPRHHSDPDLYFDFALVDSPGSPEEEIPQIELNRLITNEKDNLNLGTHGEDCHCSPKPVLTLSSSGHTLSPDSDSSSDGQYFDPDTDDNIQVHGSGHDQVDGTVLSERRFVKSNDSLSINSLSCTSESSTLSLQDYPSLEYSSCLQNDSSKDIDLQIDKQFLTPQESNDLDTESTTDSLKINGDVCDDVECDIISLENDDENSLLDEKTPINDLHNGHIQDKNDVKESLHLDCNLTVDINQKEQDADAVNAEDIEDREGLIPRVRRCSSLKTGKTPPGTPGRKKIVRFADVLGLDLADVRTFLDEIPKIPNSAYADLNADSRCFASDSFNSEYKTSGQQGDKILLALFQQPGGETNFLDRVRDNQVCLENAVVDDPIALSIQGTVRVRNLDFNKSVHIRYSLDSWKSFADLQALYVQNSCDGFSDKFSFLMYVNTISVGQRVEFAVRFQCKGVQYWDNNNGANYCFQCLPVTNTTPYAPITGAEDSWGAAFY